MWIKRRTSLGRPNQKCSSEGDTTRSPSIAVCFWATSRANSVIICSILLPTTSSTCKEENTLNMLHNFNFQTIIRWNNYYFRILMYFNIYFLQYCCLLTINGTADSHKYTYHPMTTQQKNSVSISHRLKTFWYRPNKYKWQNIS